MVAMLVTPAVSPGHAAGLSGGPFMDGGVHCRIGLQLWREGRYARGTGRPAPTAVVHLIGRSSPFSGNDDISNFGEAAYCLYLVL